MAAGRIGTRVRCAIAMSLFALAGCAGSAHHVALDSSDSWCSSQYRAHDELPPAPANLSDKERGRYDDRTRDYHVSRECQRDAERSVRHRIPDVPLPRVQ